jgi:hypothetical protein
MRAIIGLILSSGMGLIGSVALLQGFTDSDPLNGITAKEFARLNGISEIVYDCAYDLLKDKSEAELIDFIENDAIKAGTIEEPILVGSVRECIYLDPFGWHGTPNEWAIELLEIEKWER